MNLLEIVNEVLKELDRQPIETTDGKDLFINKIITFINRTMFDLNMRVTLNRLDLERNIERLKTDRDIPCLPECWHIVLVYGSVYRAMLFIGDYDYRKYLYRYEQAIQSLKGNSNET